jgi:hypothetical protein
LPTHKNAQHNRPSFPSRASARLRKLLFYMRFSIISKSRSESDYFRAF